jgi:hypothetical protein
MEGSEGGKRAALLCSDLLYSALQICSSSTPRFRNTGQGAPPCGPAAQTRLLTVIGG